MWDDDLKRWMGTMWVREAGDRQLWGSHAEAFALQGPTKPGKDDRKPARALERAEFTNRTSGRVAIAIPLSSMESRDLHNKI